MAPTPDLLTCPDGVSAETLSALRDDLLPAAEAERLRSHVARCPACQARLAQYDELRRALLAQPELEPGEHIVAGVRARLAGRPAAQRLTWLRGVPHTRARRWSGLGALAAAAAMLLLFVYVLGTHPIVSVPIGRPTPRASVVPTVTPTLSPVADIATAWGPHAAVASFSSAIPGMPYGFTVFAVTPDGRYLLGDEFSIGKFPPESAAGLLDVATRRFTVIAAGNPDNLVNSSLTWLQTDGRFALGSQEEPRADCASCDISLRYSVYDLTTGELRFSATDQAYRGISLVLLSAGMLVLGTGEGTKMVNLATGIVSTLAGIGPKGQTLLETFNWPYLVYADHGDAPGASPAVVHIRDLRTDTDIALHQFDQLNKTANIADPGQVTMTMDADTLFVAVGSGGSVLDPGSETVTTLYELDHAMTPRAQLRAIARAAISVIGNAIPWSQFSANGRLVLFGNAVWDRAERRFVAFMQNGASAATALSGNYFVIFVPTPGDGPVHLALFDTSRLPVRTGG